MSMSLTQVRSFEYVIAPNIPLNAALDLVRQSSADLIVLGNYPLGSELSRSSGDALSGKLILGYIDTAEYNGSFRLSLLGTTQPGFFGAAVPGYSNLNSVQFWQPQWRIAIYAQIDSLIAGGYDGVFLDVLDGFLSWLPGNSRGNVPNPNAAQEMANLLADIHRFVTDKHLERPFYLLGNNPSQLESAAPGALNNLDAIFNESLTYTQSPSDGTVSVPSPYFSSSYSTGAVQNIYAGHIVLGNDYAPLTDLDLLFKSFALNVSYGWIPSVTTALQGPAIFTSGPMMFSATATNSSVTGAMNLVNFIAGGSAQSAVLTGGDKNDFFIGGAGTNLISAGAGNDVIYPHPSNMPVRNVLNFTVISDVKNTSNPTISVMINGQIALAPTLVTATFDNHQVQEFKIDTTPYGTVSSVEFNAVVAPFVDKTHYANIQFQSLNFQTLSLPFSQAKYNAGSSALSGSGASKAIINQNGKIIFSSPTFPVAFPISDTRDSIAGGAGVDTVVYSGDHSRFVINPKTEGIAVTDLTQSIGPDTIIGVERIQFADKKLALDLSPNEHAGQALEFIGLMAPSLLTSPPIVGTILGIFDQGKTMLEVCQLAIDVGLVNSIAGSASNAALAAMAYRNVVGSEANSDTVKMLVGFMDGTNASFSQAGFMAAVAGLDLNQTHIGLVGLQQTGVEYV